MEPEELKKTAEEARGKGEKAVGLTTAIVAVLLASATLLGHRAHTEEIKLMVEVNDGWNFYQARHARAHQYGLAAEQNLFGNHRNNAINELKNSIEEECGFPAEKGCTSPVLKDSPELTQLAAEMANAPPDKSAKASASESSPGNEPHHEQKSEKSEKSAANKQGAVQLQAKNHELEQEEKITEAKADHFDTAELFLEVSIVLCSIALLADERLYWKLSFVTTGIGVAVALWGHLLH